MYEDDTPPAERRAQALSLDRDLLRELLGQEELRELIDPGALEEVERQLRGDPRNAGRAARLLLRLRGDLRPGQYDPSSRSRCSSERRAIRIRIAGEERLIAAEDAGRYRDALGAMPPAGLPEAFLEGGPARSARCVARFARGRGPFTTAEANDALRNRRRAEACCERSSRRSELVRGELRPGGSEREWCDPDVLRRLRRASLAALRKEVEPAEQATLGRFLPSWQGVDRRATLREALVPLQALRASRRALGVRGAASARARATSPRSLDQLCATRRVRLGRARASTASRSTSARTRRRSGRSAAAEPPEGDVHDRLREALGRGAEFWFDLLAATGLEAEQALPALWDLVWAGEVTNDAWTPLRAGRRYGVPRAERRPRRFSRSRALEPASPPPRAAGRSPSVSSPGRPDRRALAELLLERQGIVTRDGVRARGNRRRVQRGLRRAAGARDARPLPARLLRRGARRRAVRARRRRRAAAGAASPMTTTPSRSCWRPPIPRSRTEPRCPGRSGPAAAPHASREPTSCCSAASRRSSSSAADARSSRCATPTRMAPARPCRARAARERPAAVKRLAVERFDGEPVGESEAMPLLLEAGFLPGPRRVVFRRSRRRLARSPFAEPESGNRSLDHARWSVRAMAVPIPDGRRQSRSRSARKCQEHE